MKSMLRWLLLVSLPLFALDQISKQLIVDHFANPEAKLLVPDYEKTTETTFYVYELNEIESTISTTQESKIWRKPVLPDWFNLVRVHNRGVAFGMFSKNGSANWFFGIFSTLVLGTILFLWSRGRFNQSRSMLLSISLLCSGILGNLTDRLRFGYVVDFLDFGINAETRWPSFNVADSCICIAATILFFHSFRTKKEAEDKHSSTQPS